MIGARPLWLLIALVGCGSLYGVHGDGGAGSGSGSGMDAGSGSGSDFAGLVHGTFSHVVYDLDANGALATPVTVPYTSAELMLGSATLVDGTVVAVAYDQTTGTFSFPVKNVTDSYRLRLTLDGATNDYQSTAQTLKLVDAVAQHVTGPAAIGSGTELEVDLGGGNGTKDLLDIVTSGVWTRTDINQNTSPPPDYTLQWGSAAPLSGPPGLLDGSHGDHVYVEQFNVLPVSGNPTSFRALGIGSAVPAADFLAGSDNKFALDMGAQALDNCIALSQDQRTDADRLHAALTGSASPTYSAQFGVDASMAHGLGAPPVHLPLSFVQAIGSGSEPAMQIMQTQTYANPYPLPAMDAVATIAYSRLVGNATVGTVLHYAVPISPGCTATALALPTGGEIAKNYVLDQQSLKLDGAAFALQPGEDPVLTWDIDAAIGQTADYYIVGLDEVTSSLGAPLGKVAMITTTNSAIIPHELMEAGRTYIFTVIAVRGAPNAKQGDFTSAPTDGFTQGETWSGSFVPTGP